jgi:excisionase family DNA binding protein
VGTEELEDLVAAHVEIIVASPALRALGARALGRALIETLWDARDVARYLKVSRSWVYQKAEAGLLPYLKVGGLVRFVPERMRAFALASDGGRRGG